MTIMIEWRVTNGVQESLVFCSVPDLKNFETYFFNRYGGLVTSHPVTDLSVKEMPKTVEQREDLIPDKFWNFCHKCKKQFTTYHKAFGCIRCPSINLERRIYHVPKNSNQ